jgi:tetratricopeptide (TPR) repeat protein
MYQKSTHLFEQLEADLGLASGYHKLGQVLKQVGDTSQARELFMKSLELEEKTGNKQGIVECLAGLAGLAAFTGKAEHSVALFSAADLQLSSLGAPLAPADQVDWERDLEIARCALSKEDFKRAWQYGRGMTLEEVLQLVSDWGGNV